MVTVGTGVCGEDELCSSACTHCCLLALFANCSVADSLVVSFFKHACSYCFWGLHVSQSSTTCCSVADMSANFLLRLSRCFARHAPWCTRCFASHFLCCRSARHCFSSRSDSLRAVVMSGCCCRSRRLCNKEACQVINCSSMFCNRTLLNVFDGFPAM